MLTGTLLNAATILIGGALGLVVRSKLPEQIRSAVVVALALFTLGYGFTMFGESQNMLIVLGSLLAGVIVGEWLQIETALAKLGSWVEKRLMKGSPEQESPADGSKSRFVRGFMAASILFAIGPMAILGPIQNGLTGNYELLAIKATLDFFASLAFAASLGAGVLFSALVVLTYQGGISLLAATARTGVSDAMIAEMTAVGGIILLAIAISSLLEIRPIRSGNFLPALLFAPALVWLVDWIGKIT